MPVSNKSDDEEMEPSERRRSQRNAKRIVVEILSDDEEMPDRDDAEDEAEDNADVEAEDEAEDESYGHSPSPTSTVETGIDGDEEEDYYASGGRTTRSVRKKAAKGKKAKVSPRTSSRTNKFRSSMKEPSEADIALERNPTKRASKATATARRDRRSKNNSSSSDEESVWSTEEEAEAPPVRRRNKTPARPNAEKNDQVEYKVQRVIASRTETRVNWREICKNMNTTEIHRGSRWFQEDKAEELDDQLEERFLIKWSGLSFLHCSWETRDDILSEIEGSQRYFTTFAQKSANGMIFSADERLDGDYFDPAFVEVDRVLRVEVPKGFKPSTAEKEDRVTSSDYGIVTDTADASFEKGKGRLFLIKWAGTSYSDITTECERDLILQDIDYKEKLKDFLLRSRKPSKVTLSQLELAGRAEFRRLMIFRNQKDMDDTQREAAAKSYQRDLEEQTFKSGGKLRDYQAEGVAWLVSNYVNRRSSVLADEMGLGKTIQTAAFVNIVATKLNRPGPVLVVVPLSTATNWMREFARWTDLNTVLYHGSASDRRIIRELEMAFEVDRPKGSGASHQSFLNKCGTGPKADKLWMAQVVVTTPEMMITDDAGQFKNIRWEILVVDEAHRMKNHSSRIAVGLRDGTFAFNHKILLTGTPIQNDVKEFWALLNFIDPKEFESEEEFLERYGDLKVKETLDEMHERIRPYILRRLKEDVEKSVPPKEETLIEVELSLIQKQYYRAIYEKNVQFLCKKKGKVIDGPSLLNLHMELRKCCNHPFLIKGVENTVREQQAATGEILSDGDLLVKTSGKLILLDKLLPRLKENGHRCLIFSQFKIMLDILEDYLNARSMKFERIDGSITGNKRQRAIDRFQALSTESREVPFIMLLSTRAGGVGINLTAADTCIIFDSDFNPQNDIQAQSRCHRIGQTKEVNVYRLLSGKTYEMKLFHMSSLKMGLDQAVLHGFESGGVGEGAMSKDEMERLLRHGAYDIFNEVKAGTAEAESNAFVEQDIDSILARRSRTVVHENTGSKSSAKGGSFSKARFTATTNNATVKHGDEVDINDQNFWEKVVGYNPINEDPANDLPEKRRRRPTTNYFEGVDDKAAGLPLVVESDDDAYSLFNGENESTEESDIDPTVETSKECEWPKSQVEKLLRILQRYGYGLWNWNMLAHELAFWSKKGEREVKRMAWSLLLLAICEVAMEDTAIARKRALGASKKKQTEPKSNGGDLSKSAQGGSCRVELTFQTLWQQIRPWAAVALQDAFTFASESAARPENDEDQVHRIYGSHESSSLEMVFADKVWPFLVDRGWKVEVDTKRPGLVLFRFQANEYRSTKSVLKRIPILHPELTSVVEPILSDLGSSENQRFADISCKTANLPPLSLKNVNFFSLCDFLFKYAPLNALLDRGRRRKIGLGRKTLDACSCLWHAKNLVSKAEMTPSETPYFDCLVSLLPHSQPTFSPHPAWTTRHDAVLVHSVAKHGWIERDETAKALASDPDVKWGRPFDKVENATMPSSATDALLRTAERAARFLTANYELLAELTGFDTELVSKTYGLKQSVDSAGASWWVVDEASLRQSHEDSANGAASVALLPTRKDLAKRLKALFSSTSRTKLGSGKSASSSHATEGHVHGYGVLNQSDPCNLLLAEILRVILKSNLQENRSKLLVSLAHDEALKRSLESPQLSVSQRSNKMEPNEVNDLGNIVQHIALVKRSSKLARQSKNILRVILGKDPVPSRNSHEGLFPSNEVRNSECKKNKKVVAGAIGDRAISNGIMRALESSTTIHTVETKSEVGLSAIETLLVSVVASLGLPVCTQQGSEHYFLENCESSNGGNFRFGLSWANLCGVVEAASNDWLSSAQEKFQRFKEAFDNLGSVVVSSVERVNAEKLVLKAERDVKLKQLAASQAAHYSSQPEALAKKVIMLLEKIRTKMGPVGSALVTKKTLTSENRLGSKVLVWLGKETSRWGHILRILDGRGQVFAFSAADFAHEASEDELGAVAILDKKACRCIFSQIAMLTRLRSVFVTHDHSEMRERVHKAVTSCRIADDNWDKEPEWWSETQTNSFQNDFALLENLLECGFSGIQCGDGTFRCQDGSDTKDISIDESGITNASIQQRANQLTRELHSLEETTDVIHLMNERRKKGLGKVAALMPIPVVFPKSSGIRTGIQSFSTTGQTVPLATIENEVVFSDEESDDVEVVTPPHPLAKRKDDGRLLADEEATSPGKKIRTT